MSCHKEDTTATSLKLQQQRKAATENYQASLLVNPEKRSKRAESLKLTAAKPANRAKKCEINRIARAKIKNDPEKLERRRQQQRDSKRRERQKKQSTTIMSFLFSTPKPKKTLEEHLMEAYTQEQENYQGLLRSTAKEQELAKKRGETNLEEAKAAALRGDTNLKEAEAAALRAENLKEGHASVKKSRENLERHVLQRAKSESNVHDTAFMEEEESSAKTPPKKMPAIVGLSTLKRQKSAPSIITPKSTWKRAISFIGKDEPSFESEHGNESELENKKKEDEDDDSSELDEKKSNEDDSSELNEKESKDDDSSELNKSEQEDILLQYRNMDGKALKEALTQQVLSELLRDVPRGPQSRKNAKVMDLALLCYNNGNFESTRGGASMVMNQLQEFVQVFWTNRSFKNKGDVVAALQHLVLFHSDDTYRQNYQNH